jgi:hypothetical protein
MSLIRSKRLDHRYNGVQWFSHLVEPVQRINPNNLTPYNRAHKIKVFSEVRQWCWVTYGPSVELGLYNDNPFANELWSWDIEHGNLRIYIKSDKELSLLLLKWA